ncbi:MAG: hypothetical protein IID28_06555 [Planctomycetes bacterium]|nr:hypothetical protein [Planctomycetota bacterium]
MPRRHRLIAGVCAFAVASAAPGQQPTCPWDCGTPVDAEVGIVDFLTLLAQWGVGGSCDFDGGNVGITDFLELLAHWGPCPTPANDQCEGAILIDRLEIDGLIDQPFDMAGATAGAVDSPCLGEPNTHQDLWFCLGNGTAEDKTVTLTTTVDLLIEVTDGCTCPPGPLVVCGFGNLGDATFLLAQGSSVSIRLINSQDLPGLALQGSLQVLNEPVTFTGACCFADDTCTDGSQESCDAAGGFYQGDGTTCLDADCFPCADPALIDENEPDCGIPADTVNGGCNLAPPLFTPIACGDRICGTSAIDGPQRDFDWYAIELTVPSRITWEVAPQFTAVIGMVEYVTQFTGSGNCRDLSGASNPLAVIPAGQVGSVTTVCLPAGTFYFFVTPQTGQVVPCGQQYRAVATCQAGCAGACCINGNCSSTVTEQLCVFFGGSFQGEATGCFPPCGSPGAGSCCLPGCTPNCDDTDCCQAVCTIDPFCCDVTWDLTCASEVGFFPVQCDCLP